MGLPPLIFRKRFWYKISFLILGFFLGSAITNAEIGGQIDELTNINQAREEKISALQAELDQVRDNLSQHQEPTITSLTINIEFADPKLLRLEEDSVRLNIEKQIKEILKNLMGKKLNDLDPTLIPWMIENRLIETEGHSFRVKVKLLVLTEKVYLVVQAQTVSRNTQ